MTSDLGEYLREGIERATSAEQFHPSLTGRARQRHHRRALAVRAGAVTGTAAVAAAVLAATTGTGGSPAGTGHPVLTTAYVVSHAEGALAGDGDFIEQVTSVPATNLPPPAVAALVPAGGNKLDIRVLSSGMTKTTSWSFQGQVRTQGFTSGGQVAADVGPSTSGQAGSAVAVIPGAGKWYDPLIQPPGIQPDPPTCGTVGVDLLAADSQAGAAQYSALISKALSCNLFQKAGHEQVDGTDAIKLTATPDLVQQLRYNDSTASSDAALWVDAQSFLPVRMVLGPQDGSTDFAWLDPTQANLANLKVTVPDGLTEVKLPARSSVAWASEAVNGNSR